jgi:hypothetical protein
MIGLDHLIYATPDLDGTVDDLDAALGVRPAKGGRHVGEGTRNALLALGTDCYLEIVGPDPDQPAPDRPRWLGVDELDTPRLVTWVAKGTDLPRLVADARRAGIDLGDVLAGSRTRPDSTVLSWRLTDPRRVIAGGVVPFFIDWGESAHPAPSAPTGVELVSLRAEHPDVTGTGAILERLGLDLPIQPGPAPALVATLHAPNGIIELR